MISSSRKNPHLLDKLYNRELSAQFLKGKRATHKPAKQLFNQVPNRLLFPLDKTIPNIGSDILMGATKCGRFLVGYNFNLDSDMPSAYRYRLSIWSFVPGREAKKIASISLFEVTDFSYLEVQDLLTISIVQWPSVPDYLIVYGSCQRSLEYGLEEELHYTVFVTVTSLPSLACQDCIALRQNSLNDELDVRCIKHGLTIHTSFSHPFNYEFNPVLSTSIDNQIIVNTGSFVHVLEFAVNPDPKKKCNSVQQKTEPTSSSDKTDLLIRNATFVNRISYSFLMDNSYMITISDSWVPKILSLLVKWIKLGHQIEIKDLPFYMKYAIQKNSKFLNSLGGVKSESVSSMVLSKSNAYEILFSHYLPSRPRWFSSNKTSRAHTRHTSQPPDKVYEFAEDKTTGVECKFDSFRKWCLAKKIYEFSSADEDHCQENIRRVILPRPPRHNLRSVKEERRESAVARFVSGLSRESRPRKRKRTSSLRAVSNNSLWMGPSFEMADDVVYTMRRGFGHQPVSQFSVAKGFHHSFTERALLPPPSQSRRSLDPDDDEVDLCLPLRAFGSNNSELVRVSGAIKSLHWHITVNETVLDVESVCYRALEKVCQAENYKFKYLHDLDSDIVQTCPLTGDIFLLFYTSLFAKNLSAKRKKTSSLEPEEHTSEEDEELDKKYDCTLLVIWSPRNQECYLEGYSGLTEVAVGTRVGVAGSAVREAKRLREKANNAFGYPPPSEPRCFTHVADIGQLVSSSLLVDRDNLIGFVKV